MIRSVLASAVMLFAGAASATDWQAGSDRTLAFTGHYQGEAFSGRFETFDPAIRFDPADLGNARFEVKVDVASAKTGTPDYDTTMQGEEFFDSARHPQALFVTKAFRAVSGNRFEADAELTLHGKTVSLVFPFDFTVDGDSARLSATTTVKRLDFDVGSGDWSDIALIANEVEVKVDLPLTRGASGS